jgi:phosphoglycolate phosphatase-like HAD superfamily hydrolase
VKHLVIFDVDGTLCDTLSVDDECFCATASTLLGVPVESSAWEASPHITDSGIVEWLWTRHRGRLPTRQEIEAFVANFETALDYELQRAPERFGAIAGALPLLGYLEEQGWSFAFATGGWGKTARLKLQAAGLPVASLVASADDSHDRCEIFRLAQIRAVARVGAPFDRTVLVGDGVWDVRVAARLGWPMVGVGQGQRAARLRSEGASTILPDFLDRDGVLAGLRDSVIPGATAASFFGSGAG